MSCKMSQDHINQIQKNTFKYLIYTPWTEGKVQQINPLSFIYTCREGLLSEGYHGYLSFMLRGKMSIKNR